MNKLILSIMLCSLMLVNVNCGTKIVAASYQGYTWMCEPIPNNDEHELCTGESPGGDFVTLQVPKDQLKSLRMRHKR